MAHGFASSKVSVIIGDGFEYFKEHREQFDVIINDSSDPNGHFHSTRFRDKMSLFFLGPAQNLFEKNHSIPC